MNNIMGAVLEDCKEQAMREGRQKGIQEGRQKGIQEGRREGRQKGIQEGRQEGMIKGTLITLARYGKLKNEELVHAAVTICGNDYEIVKSIYQELLQNGELI